MRSIMHAMLLVLLVSGLWNSAQAATQHDPSLRWSTLETEHFYFHYHNGLEDSAQRLAKMAPAIYTEVTDFLQWRPESKTHVVITDSFDGPNGQATPLPFNQITIFASPPDTPNSLEDFDNWQHLVFKHEFVHIVHLDKAGGLPKALRGIFGRTWSYPYPIIFPLFPNTMLPNWFAEGLATYVETDQQLGVGRGQNSYFRGLMQVEVEQNFKTLDQVNMPMVSWPSSTAWYLYGVFFFQFLQETYGEAAIVELVDDYSSFPIPYMVNANANRVLGKNYYELWDEFEQYMRKRVAEQTATIDRQGRTPVQQLSNTGYDSGFSRVDAQGQIYYIQNDRISPRKLVRLDPVSGQQKIIRNKLFGDNFDLHPQAGIVISQLEFVNNVRQHFDLYHIDPDSGEETRLTHGGRYHTASWSPDGQQIIAVNRQTDKFALHLLSASGEFQEVLWQAAENETAYIGDIDWSPKGDVLVASIWRPGLGWNLELFDLAQRKIRVLTQDSFIETQPQFSTDGQWLVFSADYSGIYNIYQMRLADQQISQLSNIVGGAFLPSFSPDRAQVYYAGFSRDGQQLYQITLDNPRTFTLPARETPTSEPPLEANITPSTSGGYSALRHVYPRWWAPAYYQDELRNLMQISTGGNDPLEWHNYSVSVAHDNKNKLNDWQLQYSYDRLTPTLGVLSKRTHEFYQNNDATVAINEVDQIQLFAAWPWLQKRQRHVLSVAWLEEYTRNAWHSPILPLLVGGPELMRGGDDRLGLFNYRFQTHQLTQRAISEHSGVDFNLGAAHELSGEDNIDGTRVLGNLWWYSSPHNNSVLALRALAGVQNHSLPNFNFVSAQPLQTGGVSPEQHQFVLRGYPSGLLAFRGNAVNLLTAEWRTHLLDVEDGFMTIPMGLRRVSAKVFAEAGRIWDTSQHSGPFYHSIGGELGFGIIALYRAPLQLALGWAQGLDNHGESQTYLAINLNSF
ncbi:MAG: hypothetical protein OEW58_13635 [Gammaproteobacteria bacterium]|nr:hypothetical protein [Gammaproteobacteria bacterium]